MRQRIVILLCFICMLSACGKPRRNMRSFCYWKSELTVSKQEDMLMDSLEVGHLYVRFFDVDWNPYSQQACPVATLGNWQMEADSKQEITPCVFISSSVMEHATEVQLYHLAGQIASRIREVIAYYSDITSNNAAYAYLSKNALSYEGSEPIRDSVYRKADARFRGKIKEILIDHDWTEATRDKYFYLLKEIRKQASGFSVSATLRLWQYKYKGKAGIPPVDRCLLMCYNVEDHKEYDSENSICSVKQLSQYVRSRSYPCKLDLALPLFHWAVLFRHKEYKKIMSQISLGDCIRDTLCYRQIGESRFVFKKDSVIGDTYMRPGDELRLDGVSKEELGEAVEYLENRINPGRDTRVAFFSWDKELIDNYGAEKLKEYYSLLGH